MDAQSENSTERRARASAALAAKPDDMVETIATEARVTPAEILELLPEGVAVTAPKDAFDSIWTELTTWGEVLYVVQTEDVVVEAAGALPVGSESHGWFNIHSDSPIGGHIKKDNCAGVSFVDRAFHGRRSCSVWLMNKKGAAMLKIYVRRDENRELKSEQLAKFEALRDSYKA
ncbi:heme utilization cystosolic carrier protein HutX [Neorhizobium sp. JUb45]|uniref:heme utilization cystosolic carrier protein HutX n=1 Tax=unclassified Neorhizobium TaxID=2629175 RepID=UPI00104602DE|nr:heme utilization cystosolic carrier protein HutX [Neorhizobium sp. JUb45]TCR06571.1 heme utilization protein HuvX [Neorhizobium sp. JUb45]